MLTFCETRRSSKASRSASLIELYINVPPIRPEYNHGSEANVVADNNSANVETNIARTDMVDPSEFLRQNSGGAGIVPALIQGYAIHNPQEHH